MREFERSVHECACVLRGIGELVQRRNPSGLSDNTQGRGVGGSDKQTQPIQWEGEKDTHTRNVTDIHMHATKQKTLKQSRFLPTETSLSLPLHGYCISGVNGLSEHIQRSCSLF